MSNFFEFIEKHKFGILAAFAAYILMFVYFQMETYQKFYEIPVWDVKAELIQDEDKEIEIKPENIEQIQQQNNGEIKSISRDLSDDRKKSNEKWDENKLSKQIEEKIKKEEEQYKKESGGEAKREKIIKDLENQKNQNKTSESKVNSNTSGGNTAYKGSVMVDWQLDKRDPHQGNNWYVRNPGYTCGDKSNGVVYIKIKVDQSGKVVSATYLAENSQNASSCMIEQAKKYALMSRFSYSANATNSQEGKIIYTFVGQ
jgi:hypothetical protein